MWRAGLGSPRTDDNYRVIQGCIRMYKGYLGTRVKEMETAAEARYVNVGLACQDSKPYIADSRVSSRFPRSPVRTRRVMSRCASQSELSYLRSMKP